MRRAYDWTLQWAKTPYANLSLFTIAFAESSFFPIPPDVLLIAMTVSNRYKWLLYATITLVGSILGALLGYYIGLALYESIGKYIVEFYHLEKFFSVVQEKYDSNTFLALFTAAFTPIPFKLFTIAGGIFQVSLTDFIVGSIFGRAARFYLVAGLLRVFGERISKFIEKYFDILSLAFMLLLIGGFAATKFIS